MLETLAYGSTLIVFVVTIFLIISIARAYHGARMDRAKIHWTLNEMNRAVAQINSEDENEIMAGLQTLSAFREPDIQMKALGRLSQLTHSSQPQVAAQSQAAIARLTTILEQQPQNPSDPPDS